MSRKLVATTVQYSVLPLLHHRSNLSLSFLHLCLFAVVRLCLFSHRVVVLTDPTTLAFLTLPLHPCILLPKYLGTFLGCFNKGSSVAPLTVSVKGSSVPPLTVSVKGSWVFLLTASFGEYLGPLPHLLFTSPFDSVVPPRLCEPLLLLPINIHPQCFCTVFFLENVSLAVPWELPLRFRRSDLGFLLPLHHELHRFVRP